MSKHLDILLLVALPASGKSEVRRYLAGLSPEQCHEQFGIGPTVQLDDFPYVHLMRRISDEVNTRGQQGPFFLSPALPFRNPVDWLTLIELVNEDFVDLSLGRPPIPDSAADWIFKRFDAAREKAGGPAVMAPLTADLRRQVAQAIEDEARELLENKIAEIPDSLDGKTIVMEFARGGPNGSALPLPHPYGYRASLAQLRPDILAKASVLYIWVEPEESRRKNTERTDPDDPGSILHHGVPLAVMYGDYGCDDMAYLLESSDRPDTIRIEKQAHVFHLPVGRFDNRVDMTTFIREEPAKWSPQDVKALQEGMGAAFSKLVG